MAFPWWQSCFKLSSSLWLYELICLVVVPKLLKGSGIKEKNYLLLVLLCSSTPPQKGRGKPCLLFNSAVPEVCSWTGLYGSGAVFYQRPGTCRNIGTKPLSQVFWSNVKMGQNLRLYWSCYINTQSVLPQHFISEITGVPVLPWHDG